MRYIQKNAAPDFFVEKVQQLSEGARWQNLQGKTQLRKHLSKEQNHLCAYCEDKVQFTKCHIEHIAPQSAHPTKIFAYENLIVSCDGGKACASQPEQESYKGLNIDSCGHRKDDEYDGALFLDPTRLPDIGGYFEFDDNSAEIKPSNKQAHKAAYMIDLLNLNNPHLINKRLYAKGALVKKLRGLPAQKSRALLEKPQAFISYLRACYLLPFNPAG